MPLNNNRFTDNLLLLVNVQKYGTVIFTPNENWKLIGGVFLTHLFTESKAYSIKPQEDMSLLHFSGLTLAAVASELSSASANWTLVYENEKEIAKQLGIEWSRTNEQPELPGTHNEQTVSIEPAKEPKISIDESIPLTWAIFASKEELKDPEKIEDNWKVVRTQYLDIFPLENNVINGSEVVCLRSSLEFDKTVRSLEDVLQNEKDLSTILFSSLGWVNLPTDYDKGAITIISASGIGWYKICKDTDKVYLDALIENGLVIPFDFEAEQAAAKERIKSFNKPKLGDWWISIRSTINFTGSSFLSEWFLVDAEFADSLMLGIELEEATLENGQSTKLGKIGTQQIGFLSALDNIPEITNENKLGNQKTINTLKENALKPPLTVAHTGYYGYNSGTSKQIGDLEPESWAWGTNYGIKKNPTHMIANTAFAFDVNEIQPNQRMTQRNVLFFKNKTGLVYAICFDETDWKFSTWGHWDKLEEMINPLTLYGYYDNAWHQPPKRAIRWLPIALQKLIKSRKVFVQEDNYVISMKLKDSDTSILYNVSKSFAEKIFDKEKTKHQLLIIPETGIRLAVKTEETLKSSYEKEAGEKSLLQAIFNEIGFENGWTSINCFILKDVHNQYYHVKNNPLHFDTTCWLVEKGIINSINMEENSTTGTKSIIPYEMITIAQMSKENIGYTLFSNIVQCDLNYWIDEDGLLMPTKSGPDYVKVIKTEKGFSISAPLHLNYQKVPTLGASYRKISNMQWVNEGVLEEDVQEACRLSIFEDTPFVSHLNMLIDRDLAEEIRDSISASGKMPGYLGPVNITVKEIYEYTKQETLDENKRKLTYFLLDIFLWTPETDNDFNGITEYVEVEDFEGLHWRRQSSSTNATTLWMKELQLISDVEKTGKMKYDCCGIWLAQPNLYYYTVEKEFVKKFNPDYKLNTRYFIPNSTCSYEIVDGAVVYSETLCDPTKFKGAVLTLLDWSKLTKPRESDITAGCEEHVWHKDKKHTTVEELEWLIKSNIVNFISDGPTVITAENVEKGLITTEQEFDVEYEVIPTEEIFDPFISKPKPIKN